MRNMRYFVMALSMVAGVSMAACENDHVNVKTNPENNNDEDQTCSGDACEIEPDACGGTCTTEEQCVAGHCEAKTVEENECGSTVCAKGQICRNQHCYAPGDCDGIACENAQICYNGVCHESGDCGGLTCLTEEICYRDQCRQRGDCLDVACLQNEVCHYDGCRPVGECGGAKCEENEACYGNLCIAKKPCGENYCELDEKCVEDECVPSELCYNGMKRCNGVCCETGEFCGERQHCCKYGGSVCGHDCCDETEVCEYEMCHTKCEAGHERCELADGSEICCQSGEICASNQCYTPSLSCIDNYMCENGEYCDMAIHTCLPQPAGEVCAASQTGGEVEPTLLWYWGGDGNVPSVYSDYVNVMSAPMVADVNGDTIPEVVFNSWKGGTYVGGGILRILNGQTGELLHSSNANPYTDGGSQVAIGKLYPNGDEDLPEALQGKIDVSGLQIVTCVLNGTNKTKDFKIAAYNHEAKLIWMHTSNYNECGQSGPGIADFNGDGYPEVFSRYNVYNGQTGELIARKACADSVYWHAPCDYPAVADLDGDTVPELIGGNAAYHVNFETHELEYYYDRTADHIDGYPAVADIDNDGKPEVFVVRFDNNTVMTFKYNGVNYWEAPVAHSAEAGGPPTIANLDETPGLELTFAGMKAYLALDNTGVTHWTKPTHDWSSAKTGSSVFDFDGDGKAEVVYNDEYFLRVYDGETGDTRFCACNVSGTHWEYPVIADVNNDGHAEIVVCSNTLVSKCPSTLPENQGMDDCVAELMKDPNKLKGTHGVRVFSSPNQDWVNTRKIYNQHAYSITNVSDDGTIPKKPRQNWLVNGLNNFRLNVQPGATYLPKLSIDKISSPIDCGPTIPLYFRVNNTGWATALADVTVNIWKSSTENGEYEKVGSIKTTKDLRPGEYEMMTYEYDAKSESFNEMFFKFTFGDDAPVQCGTGNNEASYKLVCSAN